MNLLEKRILDIAYKTNSSHIGSALSSINIINEIFFLKRESDIFLLSAAHANLALLVNLEAHYGYDAEELYKNQGVHSTRDEKHKIYCSGGHLGQVFACAIGFAKADSARNIYVLISDGEWFSGIVQEGLQAIKQHNLTNLKLYCNFNGFSAYNTVDVDFIEEITLKYVPWAVIYGTDNNMYQELPFLKGLDAHYYKITDEDWKNLNEKGLLNETGI